MASYSELSEFLSNVEKKAFKKAVYAVRDDDAALDIVQDAMINLSQKYSDRPVEELPLIFTRILQNQIIGWTRHQKVKNRWVSLFSSLVKKDAGNEDFDPLEHIPAPDDSEIHQDGEQRLEQRQVLEALESEIAKLPARQREAFLMRYWDELSITETSKAMGCSEGSVKTHCSRAAQTLSKALTLKGMHFEQ